MIARALPIPAYTQEIIEGLTSPRKALPCKLFYDELGSTLFEEITRLPEYYLTRTELEILETSSQEIVRTAGSPAAVVELGAGTARKTATLLAAIVRRQIAVKYLPVDISPSALGEAKRRISAEVPGALVRPVVADFGQGFGFLGELPSPKLVLYLGSSIGNFDLSDAIAMLRAVRRQLLPGDCLLLGTDMVKSPAILLPAYDDARGITAEFNRNVLRRINREFGANFDLDSFRHLALWNKAGSRMEIYLESSRPQKVTLKLTGTVVEFGNRERVHTENSYKYNRSMILNMLSDSGFTLAKSWFDSRKWFGLHLARA
ncbi:MAG: L-histidine N(alpha)-methyltransferase [Acidobacteria bacterium]|nr:L-histidine N(alpha)-methyltransferase [Acidobacteriota bacterium]MBV9626205.1 L-histidine N(alpha)-methyltransferase [Acidobacteriota bacterium]